MIEYFMNPLSEVYKYLENDFKNRRRLADANMYVNGVVLFDKTGETLGHAINNTEIAPEYTVELILDYIKNKENTWKWSV